MTTEPGVPTSASTAAKDDKLAAYQGTRGLSENRVRSRETNCQWAGIAFGCRFSVGRPRFSGTEAPCFGNRVTKETLFARKKTFAANSVGKPAILTVPTVRAVS